MFGFCGVLICSRFEVWLECTVRTHAIPKKLERKILKKEKKKEKKKTKEKSRNQKRRPKLHIICLMFCE